MQSTIRSSARLLLAVAAALTTILGTDDLASAQDASEIGRLTCSVRASALTVDADSKRASGPDESPKRRVFSVREVSDLELRTQLRSPGRTSRRIQLKLYTPTGHLYQVLETALGEVRKDGATDRQARRFLAATATLPLAGTTIVNHSLYGRWKALAFVEGSREPCSPPYHFTIDP